MDLVKVHLIFEEAWMEKSRMSFIFINDNIYLDIN